MTYTVKWFILGVGPSRSSWWSQFTSCLQHDDLAFVKKTNKQKKLSSSKKFKAKINVPYLVYTSTENEVSFLIPFKCKYRTFMLTQSTGQVTWWKYKKHNSERKQKYLIIYAKLWCSRSWVSPSFVHILAKPSYEPVASNVPSLWKTGVSLISLRSAAWNILASFAHFNIVYWLVLLREKTLCSWEG